MKVIAVALNVIALCFLGFLFYSHGVPDSDELPVVSLAVAVPVVNLIVLHRYTRALQGLGDSSGLISLYIRRKRLEQEKLIRELQVK